ncbi:MAG: ABC transporter ATP-binding protein [Steroidobacteraceae bacterium]
MSDVNTAPAIAAHNISKRIDGRSLLSNISLQAQAGEIIGILGKNGAGKTTLLETLLGFSRPTQGYCEIYGDRSLSLSAATKARIGYVPQTDELINDLTGRQQLDFTASFYPRWNHELIQTLADRLEIPLLRPIAKLSGGERQKLSTLLALGHTPDLLVLDEPVASLDPIARRTFLQQLLEIAQDGQRTVLLSSHIVSDLERAASRIWILRDGALIWYGEQDALKESVVRLHIRAARELPATLAIPHTLSQRINGQHASLVVRDWHAAQQNLLAQHLNAQVEIEQLTLEDIFMELHK